MDADIFSAFVDFVSAIMNAAATIVGALIVGYFGTVIAQRYSREKDRQDKESQWRSHAIELTKLEHEKKLKKFEKDPATPLRPSILDFLANYRDLTELDKVSPKELYVTILNKRVTHIGKEKAEAEEKA